MIPRSLSGETHQDSEPGISVDPADPRQIAATAFTPDPIGGPFAPIFISSDGGATWLLNTIVPSSAGSGNGTMDITVAFGGSSRLYGGILRDPSTNLEVLRTRNFAAPTAMTSLYDRASNDQPFTVVATVGSGAGAGRDRVYIGNNDFQARPATSTLDVLLNASGTGAQTPQKVRLESRVNAGQNGPQVRPTVHPDGTVYAAYYGWRTQSGSWPGNTLVVTADVVVVRDDDWGQGTAPFQALKDPADGLMGLRVVSGVSFPFNQTGAGVPGQQRLGGSIAIAVDPTNSARVYLSWADRAPNGVYRLHLRSSSDRGVTWTPNDLRTVDGGTNAALAVSRSGRVGFLYQQLTGSGAGARWVTQFEHSADGVNWTTVTLAAVPAATPAAQFDPYIGDYTQIAAVGDTFFGVFSANNTPDLTHFPNGVTYLRNVDTGTRRLLDVDGTTPVSPSIDPFYFRVTP